MQLDKFFAPKSVAIIGASSNKQKLGWQILSNLKNSKYQGKIYPINLKSKTILGEKAYANILDVKTKIDLALIVIPADKVEAEILKCAEKGIKNIIIISAGFKEASLEGKNIEEKIVALAEENNINILGPNCLGLININSNLNLSFVSASKKKEKRKTKIAGVSQSGALGSALLDWFDEKSLDLDIFVSLGNQAVIKEADVLDYLADDENIDLVVLYLEEISSGEKIMTSLSRLSRKKPCLVIKSGRSDVSSKMAASHTGSLAGSWQAAKTILERSGAILLDNLDDLFQVLELWPSLIEKDYQKILKQAKINFISNAGGALVMSLDSLDKHNLDLAKWPKSLKVNESKWPKNIKFKNPLDILGDADALRYEKSLKLLLVNKEVKIIICILTPQSSSEVKETAQKIVDLNKAYNDKIILPVFIGGSSVKVGHKIFSDNYLPVYNSLDPLIFSLAKFSFYFDNKNKIRLYNKQEKNSRIEKKGKEESLKNLKVDNNLLDYLQSFKLLKKYDIDFIPTKKLSENIDKISKKEFPLVLKAVGPNFNHKTDKGAIIVDIEDKDKLKLAQKNLSKLLKKDDYLVYQSYVKNSLEIIIGFKREKNLGPLIMVGWGGTKAEIIKDLAYFVDDINFEEAKKVIKKLKIYQLLSGYRGGKKYSLDSLARTLQKVAILAKENPEIKELDINPLFLEEKKSRVGDVRIIF